MEEKQFNYSYSAKEQEEIRKIREKYSKKPEKTTLERLRELDRKTTQKGTVISLILGIVGALVMGFGMSCVMVWGGSLLAVGVAVGLLGIVMVALAYPLYTYVTKKEKERLAPQIISLADELSK